MATMPEILIEAVPYILGFRQKVMVVKMGGSFIEHEAGKAAFIEDIALLSLLGMKVIIVHGGGKEISARLNRLGLQSKFESGYRVTSEEVMDEVEMTLSGRIGKELVLKLNQSGVKAAGINGKDGLLIKAVRKVLTRDNETVDLGQVGDVEAINPEIIKMLVSNDYIPVVSPIGYDELGNTYNINADDVAAAIAGALEAEKLILMTDVDGVYLDYPNPESFQSKLDMKACKSILENDKNLGGMGPKLNCALDALASGVHSVHLINGSVAHSLLLEIFSDSGVGTMITQEHE